jgi:excinuclease ABC subunit A
VVLVEQGSEWIEHRFSEKFSCPDHPECALEELEPRLFSFNSPQGACPACAGLGQVQDFDAELVVNDPDLGVAEGAVEPWRRNGRRMNIYYSRLLRGFCKFFDVPTEMPFSKLTPRIRRYLMEGVPEAEEEKLGVRFEGVMPNLKRRYLETESEFVKERLLAYMSTAPCPTCNGHRLRPQSLAVKVRGRDRACSIADTTAMNVERAAAWFAGLQLSKSQSKIAEPILKEIGSRLGFLSSVGLEYLTLDRASGTLSGGEIQRLVIARALAQEAPVLILDEPTSALDIGHQQQALELVDSLRREQGLTIISAMHDLTLAGLYADRLVLMHEGHRVAEGTAKQVLKSETLAEFYGVSARVHHEPDGTVVVIPQRPSHL